MFYISGRSIFLGFIFFVIIMLRAVKYLPLVFFADVNSPCPPAEYYFMVSLWGGGLRITKR